jgi:hypothetical protein
MKSGAHMTLKTIQMQREYPLTTQGPDWFDDNHDSMLILQSRDYEENGLSPQPEVSYLTA